MSVHAILQRSLEGQCPTQEEALRLLQVQDGEEQELLFRAARRVRERYFHREVFLYGFVYFSTHCQNDCTFCLYRRSNRQPVRYRKSTDEIVRHAVALRDSGVHLIDLTMGEDPYFLTAPHLLAEIVRRVKDATGLPVMVSPGMLSREHLQLLQQAGADWYALYQETHNRTQFERLRLHQDFEARARAKEHARQLGLLVEEGLLVGAGGCAADIARSISAMRRMRADQVRSMTFIPQAGAPLAGGGAVSFREELLCIAVMRLCMPDALIPASLDVDGLHGLQERLQAGANVVTSLVLPREGYAGVANAHRDIDEGGRTVAGIVDSLARCGLTAASADSYRRWVHSRKRLHDPRGDIAV